MSEIHVVGHCCLDITPGLDGPAEVSPGELREVGAATVGVGGAVGNCSRLLRALGRDVTVSAAVGHDAFGDLCEEILTGDLGSPVSLQRVAGHGTSYSVVIQPPGGDRAFWHHTGANDVFDASADLPGSAIVHFGYPQLNPGMCVDAGRPIVDLFRRARASRSATSLDLAYCAVNSPLRRLDWAALFAAVLPLTDVFCPSWEDLTSVLDWWPDDSPETIGAAAEQLVDMGAPVVLITAGSRGACLRTGDADSLTRLAAATGIDPAAWERQAFWAEPNRVPVVTTLGAGDSFKAAFLAALLDGVGPADALAYANLVIGRFLQGLPITPDLRPGDRAER